MMKIWVIVLLQAVVTFTLEIPTVTGPTPEKLDCSSDGYLCMGRADGNYGLGPYTPHHFVQCTDGVAYCQACWPAKLVFKHECNQCLYSLTDECVTTKTWKPATTNGCSDICPYQGGPHFSGNLADPKYPNQYVACWEGLTVGCIACPKGLLFNEKWNACLYDGKYKTQSAK